MDALIALVRKDITLYFSNRRALLVTLAAPILIAAFFGSVMGGTPKKPSRVPVAVVDADASELSRRLVARLKEDTAFDLQLLPQDEAIARVRDGKVRAAAVIPAGFGERAPLAMFAPNAPKPEVVVHYDPSQAMVLPMVRGLFAQHAMAVIGQAAFSGQGNQAFLGDARTEIGRSAQLDEGMKRELLALFESVERVQQRQAKEPAGGGGGGFTMPFETREAQVAGRMGGNYNGYAHAFAGMGVQFVLFMGIELGVGLLLMRRMGLWKRLRAAPVSRGLLLGSRIASGTIIAAMLLAGIYAAALAVFGVRIEGSVVGFVLVAVAFAVLTASFGLLIAALGRTPEATRGLAVLATLLLVMLGGAWVPTFVFPEWLQQATLFVPTRWAIDGLEAMTWRGQGLEAAWMPVAAMLACSAVFAALAVKRFAWEE